MIRKERVSGTKMGKEHTTGNTQNSRFRGRIVYPPHVAEGETQLPRYTPVHPALLATGVVESHQSLCLFSVLQVVVFQGIINEVSTFKSCTVHILVDPIRLFQYLVAPFCRQVTSGTIVADGALASWETSVLFAIHIRM